MFLATHSPVWQGDQGLLIQAWQASTPHSLLRLGRRTPAPSQKAAGTSWLLFRSENCITHCTWGGQFG